MAIRQLTKREQKILTVCIGTLLMSFVYNGMVKPLREEIAGMDQNIEIQQKQINKNLQILRKAEALDGQYNYYLDQFKQSKTDEQVMSTILSEIEEVAGGLALRISDLKPQRLKADKYANRFSVSLSIESAFGDVIHFLYILQKQPHYFAVEDISFIKDSRRKENNMKTQIVLSKIFIYAPSGEQTDDHGGKTLEARAR